MAERDRAPARTGIPVLGPFSWERTLEGFATFQPMARHVAGKPDETLRLAFRLDGTFEAVGAAVRADGETVVAEIDGTSDIDAASAQVARILSLNHDARSYPEVGDRDPLVGELMTKLYGLRPLCFTSPYECAAWAVISQRISMRQAASIQSRLVDELGEVLSVGEGVAKCFPHPEALLELRSFPGLPETKVERLRSVARAALDRILEAKTLIALGPVEAPKSVLAINGIGAFWSSAIYLRACGITDIFPDEPVSIAALARLHGRGETLTADELHELAEPFRPWRMWVCYLLRVAAGSAGLIPGVKGEEMRLRRQRPVR